MNPFDWNEVEDLFAAALTQPNAELQEFLRERCADRAFRERIEALLKSGTGASQSWQAHPDGNLVDVLELADIVPGSRIGPFIVLDRIGRGGMGCVFLANDGRLERKVALKCLLSFQRTDAELRARILGEARASAGINHPNIATVYDVFEEDNRAFIVMEYIEGESLAVRLKRERLPIDAVVGIGRQLASAIAAAHARGIIHRDLKPGNIQLTPGGLVKVLDFGLAQAAALLTTASIARRMEGVQAQVQAIQPGTPGYMSPEQLLGWPLDDRTDIYSLGVVLFEMATGRRPYIETDPARLALAVIAGEAPRADQTDPAVPARLADTISKSLARNPATRFQSAGELDDSLAHVPLDAAKVRSARVRHLAYVSVAVVGISLLAAGFFSRFSDRWHTPRRGSVAVVAFKNLSADPENDYFSDGIADDIVAELSKIGDIRVISATSLHDKDESGTATQIAARMGVSAVLAGSVRRDVSRVRIVSQLFDGQTGEELWSESYDRELRDIFAIQSEVSRKIAVALKGQLSDAEIERLRPHGSDFDAFNLYLKGRYYWSERTEDGLNRSVQYFLEALKHDAKYAPAYAGLADAYTLLGVYGMMPRVEALSRAGDAASEALRLDESLAEAHASLGLVRKHRFEWDAAEVSFKRAIALKPGYAAAHQWYATYLVQRGRFPEATSEIKTALSLDPLSVGVNDEFGAILISERRYGDAITQLEQSLQIDPRFTRTHMMLAEAYSYQAANDRALLEAAEAEKSVALGAEDPEVKALTGFILARAGHRDEALKIVEELSNPSRQRGAGVAGGIASIYAGLGDADRALEWLYRARAMADPEIAYLKVDPRWDRLRTNRRFESVLESLGLAH